MNIINDARESSMHTRHMRMRYIIISAQTTLTKPIFYTHWHHGHGREDINAYINQCLSFHHKHARYQMNSNVPYL